MPEWREARQMVEVAMQMGGSDVGKVGVEIFQTADMNDENKWREGRRQAEWHAS